MNPNLSIYWRNSNGTLNVEVCCPKHLADTLLNVQTTTKVERTRGKCDCCEYDRRDGSAAPASIAPLVQKARP